MEEQPILKMGLYSAYPELDEWLIDTTAGNGYELESRTDDQLDLTGLHAVIIILNKVEPIKWERLSLLTQIADAAERLGLDVIWIGPCVEETEHIYGRAHQFIDPENDMKADSLLAPLNEYSAKWQSKATKKPAGPPLLSSGGNEKKSTPNAPAKTQKSTPHVTQPMETETAVNWAREQLPQIDPFEKVIVVGSRRGCGSSFVALNIAAIHRIPLLTMGPGGITAWFGLETTSGPMQPHYFKSVGGVQVASHSYIDLNSHEAAEIIAQFGSVLVEVGEELSTSIWQNAGTQIFVSTPDPQWQRSPYPPGPNVVRVMNRYPKNFPASPEEIFGVEPHLVIDDLGAEGFLSLWGQKPWILTQDERVQSKWRNLFGSTNPGAAATKEETSWNQRPSW